MKNGRVCRMKGKLVLILSLAMAVSGCGLVKVEGEILDPTEALDREMFPSEVPTDISDTVGDNPADQVVEGVLPAPAIYLRAEEGAVAPGRQNLWRLEADGVTETQMTDEAVPVTSFDVSPVDGAIAYTTFGDNDLVLIEWDGSHRRVLVDGVDLSAQPNGAEWGRASNANVAWSPDGSQIAYGYGGINIISAEGGDPRVLVPDKIITISGRASQESRYYRPLAWSPDGNKILALEGFGIEGSAYAVVDVESGEVVSLGSTVLCCEPSWSLDSQSFYFSSATFGMIQPGLWRVNAETGEVTTLIRGMEGAGLPDITGESMSLIQSARQLADGKLYAFAGFGTYDDLYRDEEGNEIAPKLTMTQFSIDGTEANPLRSDAYPIGEALWAQDGSGALVTVMVEGEYPSGTLLWLTNGDAEPVVLKGRGFQPRWGKGNLLPSSSGEAKEARYGLALSAEYAGLVYATEEGLWLVEGDGRSRFLIDQPDGTISADGNVVVYEQGDPGDLWLEDLVTGERRNVTNTVDRREGLPVLWPEQPDLVVFASKSVDEELFGFGQPTVVKLDGSGYRILDDQKAGPFALSPDGVTIAFGCCDGPGILYRWPDGPTAFNPLDYGVNAQKLFLPAWSPDGQKLAWVVSGELEPGGGQYQSGVAVFDLGSKTAEMIHAYQPMGGSSVEHFLSWSPDGNWLAFVTYAELPAHGRKPALYVSQADGLVEYYLGVGFNPIWSPDGKWLIYNDAKENPSNLWDHKVIMVPVGEWESMLPLPIHAEVKGWIEG